MVFAAYVGRIWWAMLKRGVMCQPHGYISGQQQSYNDKIP